MPNVFRNITLRTRDTDARHASWLELFYDLSYTAAMSEIAELLLRDLTWWKLFLVILIFISVWWSWVGHTLFTDRFETEDSFFTVATFLQTFAALFLAIFIRKVTEHQVNLFALTYIVSRFILWVMYLRVYFKASQYKKITRLFLVGFGIGIISWIISLFIPEPYKYTFWVAGIFVDFATPWIGNKILTKASVHSKHLAERLGLFTIIVMGGVILRIALSAAEESISGMVILSVSSGFALTVALWWIYFRYLETYVSEKEIGSGQIYIYTHGLIYFGLILLTAGINTLFISALVDPFIGKFLIFSGILLVLLPLEIYKFISHRNKKIFYFSFLFLILATILLTLRQLNVELFLTLLTLALVVFAYVENKQCVHILNQVKEK